MLNVRIPTVTQLQYPMHVQHIINIAEGCVIAVNTPITVVTIRHVILVILVTGHAAGLVVCHIYKCWLV